MKTIQIPLTTFLKVPAKWRVNHHSSQAIMAISRDATYHLLVVKVPNSDIETLSHFTDGQVTCSITGILRQEYLEIDEKQCQGSFVTGYLNHHPMQAYAILLPGKNNNRLVLVNDRKGQTSIAGLRQQAVAAIRTLIPQEGTNN